MYFIRTGLTVWGGGFFVCLVVVLYVCFKCSIILVLVSVRNSLS